MTTSRRVFLHTQEREILLALVGIFRGQNGRVVVVTRFDPDSSLSPR